jgi:tetratricopeptide (TPR) repeat protein
MTVALLSALWIGFSLPAGAQSKDPLERIERLADAFLLEEARALLDSLPAEIRSGARGKLAEGRLLFCEGEAEAAASLLRAAIEEAKAELGWKAFRNRVEATASVLGGMRRVVGPSGRFAFFFRPGVDELLVSYADEALERQRQALEGLLGSGPGFVVQVVIAPDEASLADLSGLTTEQIERTGTVGVTKYGRIQILSPRRLATGYPWLETLAHEITHVFVSRASRDEAPIWLHEGLAKLLEQRWKGVPLAPLLPEEAYLLDRASREGRLIPLRRLHPSIAHLPSQEDAALAYAETASMVRYVFERSGEDGIKKLLEGLAGGSTMDLALEAAAKLDMKRLQRWWRQEVVGTRQTPAPVVQLMAKRFKRGRTTAGGTLESLLEPEARKLLRIGDLLRLRGHLEAAVYEYRQAAQFIPSPTPALTDRLAACLLELNRAAEAESMLREITELYPNHATAHVQIGQTYEALNKAEEAQSAYLHAVGLSPFHPALHCALGKLLERTKSAGAARAQENCALLSRHAAEL